jgi:hypothetical protein
MPSDGLRQNWAAASLCSAQALRFASLVALSSKHAQKLEPI